MRDNIQIELETALENEVASYNLETDPKVKLDHLKRAAVIEKLIRDKKEQEADEQNRQERLRLDEDKFKLEKSKFNFEKSKQSSEQEIEARKIDLAAQQHELDKSKFEFEKSKQSQANKSAIVDVTVKCALAVLALVPSVLAFAGGIMTLKLEYNDMGRTPSTFKDFMRKI